MGAEAEQEDTVGEEIWFLVVRERERESAYVYACVCVCVSVFISVDRAYRSHKGRERRQASEIKDPDDI